MKQLKQFLKFNNMEFFKHKVLFVQDIKELYLYENNVRTNKKIGLQINAIIIEDGTEYSKNVTNQFEKLNLKYLDNKELDLNIKDMFKLIGEYTVSIYGQFQNEISLTINNNNIQLVNDDE